MQNCNMRNGNALAIKSFNPVPFSDFSCFWIPNVEPNNITPSGNGQELSMMCVWSSRSWTCLGYMQDLLLS